MGTREEYFPSIWLKATDLGDVGTELAVQIEYEGAESIEDPQTGKSSIKPTIRFFGVEKSMILNVTNWDAISALHGDDSGEWAGKWITLYVATVDAFKKTHVVIRVRDTAPAPVALPA